MTTPDDPPVNGDKDTGSAEPDTRERILIEASRLLAVNGYSGTTTRDIAAAVGISQPSLFFHFSTKLSIVEELYRHDLVPAVQGLERLVIATGTAGAKLYAMICAEVTRVIDSPYDMRAHISLEALNHPDLTAYRDLLDQFDHMTRLLLRTGQESGQFVPGDPWLAHQIVIGFLARANVFAENEEIDRSSHPEEAAALILRSLLSDPATLDIVRLEAAELAPKYLTAE